MRSENTGKNIIKSIRVSKDHVTLSFAKRERLQISKEAYLSSYLYVGKKLTNSEIDKLNEITALSSLLKYATSLLNKRRYSERKLYEKLIAKEDDKKAVKSVINKLKEMTLIDDKAYMNDLIVYYDERKYGKNKTIKHLKEKGIPDSLIEEASFSSRNELKKAEALLPKLEKKYDKYAYENKKKHIYASLVSQGFDIDIAREVISDVKKGQPKKEKEILLKDYKKIKERYKKKYDGYELKQKIYAALASKGYKHSEIKQVLEEDYL